MVLKVRWKPTVKTCQVCGLGMYDYSKNGCKKYCSDCKQQMYNKFARVWYHNHKPIIKCVICDINPIGHRKKLYCDDCSKLKHPVTGKNYSPLAMRTMLEQKHKNKDYHNLNDQQQLTELMKCTRDALKGLDN